MPTLSRLVEAARTRLESPVGLGGVLPNVDGGRGRLGLGRHRSSPLLLRLRSLLLLPRAGACTSMSGTLRQRKRQHSRAERIGTADDVPLKAASRASSAASSSSADAAATRSGRRATRAEHSRWRRASDAAPARPAWLGARTPRHAMRGEAGEGRRREEEEGEAPATQTESSTRALAQDLTDFRGARSQVLHVRRVPFVRRSIKWRHRDAEDALFRNDSRAPLSTDK